MTDLSQHSTTGVALLIDGENLGASFAGQIIAQAGRHGTLIVKRVYGNTAQINRWCEAPGFRVIHSGTGKNAADILLAIEAVDLAHSRQVSTFVLASSDGDFRHLAHRLREAGHNVVGVGDTKAPETFRQACSKFHELKGPRAEGREPGKFDAQIHTVIKGNSERRKLPVASLNGLMRKQYDIKISELPEKTWRKYLESKPDLYRCDAKGPDAHVELLT